MPQSPSKSMHTPLRSQPQSLLRLIISSSSCSRVRLRVRLLHQFLNMSKSPQQPTHSQCLVRRTVSPREPLIRTMCQEIPACMQDRRSITCLSSHRRIDRFCTAKVRKVTSHSIYRRTETSSNISGILPTRDPGVPQITTITTAIVIIHTNNQI